MRWLIAPLVAALLLGGSGFLDALERTTEASARLAESSASAPRTTRAAREEVEGLPAVARLTGQQADAFDALADALDGSAERVEELTSSLDGQVSGLEAQANSIDSVAGATGCIRDRLTRLLGTARDVPLVFDDLSEALTGISRAQSKSLRHLRSINRKMTALGLVARASDVEPPPPPEDAPTPEAGAGPGDSPC